MKLNSYYREPGTKDFILIFDRERLPQHYEVYYQAIGTAISGNIHQLCCLEFGPDYKKRLIKLSPENVPADWKQALDGYLAYLEGCANA